MKKLSLLEVLEGLDDGRRSRSVQYLLHEVLFIMLTAVICGATSYVKVELFAKSKETWLRKYLTLENGIPDACTFRNIIKSIDTEQIHTIFVEWMKAAVGAISGVIAVDGKQARRTKDAEKKPLHVVSAFSSERKLVLGQLACEEKSNEITTIPKLLEMLEIQGCIVTIDAMGTQTEIADKIIQKNADYILALKGNQQGLYEDVRLYFEDYMQSAAIRESKYYARTISQGHGRIHYFIYSCKGMSAKQIMDSKRAHWEIENGCIGCSTWNLGRMRAERERITLPKISMYFAIWHITF